MKVNFHEISFGYMTKELAMECRDRQAKREDCVSAKYIDPDAPVVKVDEGDAHV